MTQLINSSVKKNIKPEEIKITLEDITGNKKKSNDDITALNSRLDTLSVSSDLIAVNKKSIEEIKTVTDAVKDDFPKIATKLDKVKIPHEEDKIKNLVYVVDKGIKDWISDDDDYSIRLLGSSVNGIYRFTVISEHQFDITITCMSIIGRRDDGVGIIKVSECGRGINTVSIFIDDTNTKRYNFKIKSVDATVARASLKWVLEFVTEM